MIKEAQPAWVRALQKGLSAKSIARLTKELPQGVTRQISGTPIGRGSEGKIFPAFTGGIGESVIKRFHSPNERKVEALKSLFSQHPEIFPTIVKSLPKGKGYIMPKYYDNPPVGIGETIKNMFGMGSGAKWSDFISYLKANAQTRFPIRTPSRFSSMNPIIKAELPSELRLGNFKINDLSRYSNNVMFDRTGKPVIVDPYIL